jgi:hypothetical protein
MRDKKWKKNGGKFKLDDIQKREKSLVKAGYQPSRYLGFCRTLLSEGYELRLYEARQTHSKYITVEKGGKSYKVRFSNHKPIQSRQESGDCDFWVGVSHGQVTTTEDAISAVRTFFTIQSTETQTTNQT